MKSLVPFLFTILFSFLTFAHDANHNHGGHQNVEISKTAHLVFRGGALHAHVTWEQGPKTGGESVVLVEFKDGATHKAVEPGAALKVELWMPSMGHGSAPTKLTSLGSGMYRVNNVMFIMRGDWDVRFILLEASGAQEVQTISLKL